MRAFSWMNDAFLSIPPAAGFERVLKQVAEHGSELRVGKAADFFGDVRVNDDVVAVRARQRGIMLDDGADGYVLAAGHGRLSADVLRELREIVLRASGVAVCFLMSQQPPRFTLLLTLFR